MGLNTFLHPLFLLSVLVAISIHEFAHAWAARRLGDHTAEDAGRLTINPLSHLDPLGTLMFLIVGFGWAKPVPVDPRSFRHPKRDTALVALAGPVSNLILAFVCFAGLHFLSPSAESLGSIGMAAGDANGQMWQTLLAEFLMRSVFLNLALMAFNLLPIAPLDGSKILQAFVPWTYEASYDQFMRMGPIILLVLILIESFLPIRLISGWVFGVVDVVLQGFSAITGIF